MIRNSFGRQRAIYLRLLSLNTRKTISTSTFQAIIYVLQNKQHMQNNANPRHTYEITTAPIHFRRRANHSIHDFYIFTTLALFRIRQNNFTQFTIAPVLIFIPFFINFNIFYCFNNCNMLHLQRNA